MGLTVNIVVLFSLILAVGMLVDGAIVVTEYADRKMTEGAEPQRSLTALAAKRMAWPIIGVHGDDLGGVSCRCFILAGGGWRVHEVSAADPG